MAYPIGTGESKSSPDGSYEASVTDWYDESFFGESRRWFEFKIAGETEQQVITGPIPGPHFGSRSEHTVICWAEDSSFVKFVFPTTEIMLKP